LRNHRFHHSPYRQAVLAERAREMRVSPTTSEALLWHAIRGRRLGVQFRRQVPLGRYIVDFFAAELSLVIDVDGGYHHRVHRRSDTRRDDWLRRRGYFVLRLSDSLVLCDLPAALTLVSTHIAARRA
jgi:very-short-patch-repair endonuclease